MNRFIGNKSLMVLLALIGVGILLGFAVLVGSNKQGPVVTPTPSPIVTQLPVIPSKSQPTVTPTMPLTTTPIPKVSRVNIFLVALNDNGKSGTKIGCGDSLIPVSINIQSATTPLKAALEQLLAIKTQFFGQSGLYNSLYQSNLKVDRAVIQNGKATVNLSGTTQLGGVCDNPRFEQQIKQTVFQFPSVKQASIFINRIPIEQIVSEK